MHIHKQYDDQTASIFSIRKDIRLKKRIIEK